LRKNPVDAKWATPATQKHVANTIFPRASKVRRDRPSRAPRSSGLVDLILVHRHVEVMIDSSTTTLKTRTRVPSGRCERCRSKSASAFVRIVNTTRIERWAIVPMGWCTSRTEGWRVASSSTVGSLPSGVTTAKNSKRASSPRVAHGPCSLRKGPDLGRPRDNHRAGTRRFDTGACQPRRNRIEHDQEDDGGPEPSQILREESLWVVINPVP